MIDCGLYASAYPICQKIAAAEYRDEFVRRLLSALLTQAHTTTIDWEFAQQIAALLFQLTDVERTQSFLKNFGRAYPARDYRRALQALIQFSPTQYFALPAIFAGLHRQGAGRKRPS